MFTILLRTYPQIQKKIEKIEAQPDRTEIDLESTDPFFLHRRYL
jgi:hypothetical protein